MASEITFVDTNILVYAHDASERSRQPVARARLEALWASGTGVLSTQVLQEFYVVATRKFTPQMARREARAIVSLYATWPLVQIDPTLILAASQLEQRLRLSFWDALIIEAARVAGAATLLSEDLQHGRRIGGMRIEDPFRPD